MSDFILLEPSSDIHLVRSNFPAGKREVHLRVYAADANATTRLFDISEITGPSLSRLQFDFFPLTQNIVTFNPATRTLTPGTGIGTVHMQVRYLDPAFDLSGHYHYILARIQVHETMNGWWFGNNSLSIFLDPDVAHSQPSTYALFDETQPGRGVVGDITGHDYVDLDIDDQSVCMIDFTVPGPTGKFRDRLRGLTVGTTKLRGSLIGQNREIDVRVVDMGYLPGSPSRPVLKRELTVFDASAPRIERYNILLLADGYTAAGLDEARFDFTVKQAAHDLFDLLRHAPYNLLKGRFNVWSRFEPSVERGITCGPQLTDTGRPIVSEPRRPAGTPADAYTLTQLVSIVGLPTQADEGRTLAQLTAAWSQPGADPQRNGFQANRAVQFYVDEWRRLIPRLIPQAVDSFYGTIQGRRLGDRLSVIEPRAAMVSTPPLPHQPGDPTFEARATRLCQRMYQWYIPDLRTVATIPDSRRYAPEYADRETRLLIGHFNRLADPLVAAGNADRDVGRLWDPTTPLNPTAATREISSAGLAGFLLNTDLKGGMNYASSNPDIPGRVVYAPVRGLDNYSFVVNTSDPNVRRVTLTPRSTIDMVKVVNVLAHEYAHSFNLGDEYELRRGPAPPPQPARPGVEGFDNLTHVETIRLPGLFTSTFPTPVNPNNVKWARLHRIQLSDMVTRRTTNTAAGIVVQLAPGATARWDRLSQADRQRVVLRRFRATPAADQQLPINTQTPAQGADDLYPNLVIAGIDHTASTLTLTGAPNNPAEFPPGSVVYVPRQNSGGQDLRLVEEQIMQFMINNIWTPGLPPGRALTENHDPNPATNFSDNPAVSRRDLPPAIPGVTFPSLQFTLLGLYEGGGTFTTHVYRPAGACKMRDEQGAAGEGEFCFVCKYLMVNRIDPGMHGELDTRFYPR